MDSRFLLISPFLPTIFYTTAVTTMKGSQKWVSVRLQSSIRCSNLKKLQLNCQHNRYSGRTPKPGLPECEVELPATLVNSRNNSVSLQVFFCGTKFCYWFCSICKTSGLFACFN